MTLVVAADSSSVTCAGSNGKSAVAQPGMRTDCWIELKCLLLGMSQGPPAARDVQLAAAQIREVQHCTHPGRWLRVDEGDNCEECGQYLPDFILECRNCHLRACRRCKLNRL
jgi:hypothetical protein